MAGYSVLMTVYRGEKPEYLRQSIQSMLDQTVPADDFVLVCDGPLTTELDGVISGFSSSRPDLFNIVRLDRNTGIGGATNAGLPLCRCDLIAKMDSDDIARRERCEKQIKLFEEDPQLSISGSQLAEFMGDPSNTVSVRTVPLTHEDIARYARRRNPFNNQTVIYRKSAALAAGGYGRMRRCEDYDLYVRMLQRGCRARNIDETLVDYRLSGDAYQRRAMWSNLAGFVTVRWRMYRSGFSSFLDFLVPCAGQIVLSLVPAPLKEAMYRRVLRKN